MTRYRSFLFPESEIGEGFLVLDPRESHHLARVFRAKAGETVEVLDGQGRKYQGRIEEPHAKRTRIVVDTVEELPRPAPRVTLLQAVSKGKAMDLILRMATEIGASTIQPVLTDQGERSQPKSEKWQLTMIEACKQCGLGYVPELAELCSLKDWLKAHDSTGRSLKIVASLEEGSRPLADVLRTAEPQEDIIVAVGPAGDFSVTEYELLRAANFQPVRLGANVLRAETAAAYILSVVDQLART